MEVVLDTKEHVRRMRTTGILGTVAILACGLQGCATRQEAGSAPSPSGQESFAAAIPGAKSRPEAPEAGPAPALAADRPEAPVLQAATTASAAAAPKEPQASRGGTPRRLLENAAGSEIELGLRVLEALKARDAKALQALRITEEEYREILFPEFPEARASISVDFHWWHLDVRSQSGIQEAIEKYGGLDLELLDMVQTRETLRYATYEILSRIELLVRFQDGEEAQIRVFGSIVHLDDQYKILGFPS